MALRQQIGTLLGAAIIMFGTAAYAAETANPEPVKETVTINLSHDLGPATYRASGFLHAMSATKPGSEMVDPLKPKTFRMCAEDWHHIGAGAFANYERVKKLGATMQVVVSDSHGYALAHWWPGDNGDWGAWEHLVESLVKRAQDAGCDFEWDIWNEPNHNYFWPHDQDRFFETWQRAVLKIRSMDPDAVIIGPSVSYFMRDYLEAFLLYAKENQVLPDVLAWHELGGHTNIVKNVAYMRSFMSKNGINIRRITLNEIIGGDRQLNPGATVHFLAAVEQARVDSACHACWNDKDPGVSGCENQSLDGILTHPDGKPRAPWWVYKAYADITGRLSALKSTGKVTGIAGRDSASKTAQVLLGRDSDAPACVEVEFVNIRAANYLINDGKVRVVVEKIPPSGWDALSAPEKVIDADYEVENGTLRIVLPEFGASDAYTIRLGR